jgi:cytochrome c oxidase assembly protein subunit 11
LGVCANRASAICIVDFEVPSALNTSDRTSLQLANQKLAWKLVLVSVFFAAFGFALVPLYDVICRVTGINGRTNSVPDVQSKSTQVDLTRWVTVEFLSHAMPGVGLEFAPEQFSMRVHPGELVHTNYVVKNATQRVFVGQAVPSLTPAVAAPYFQKIECFCFSQQTLQAGETRTMPVVFVVKPDMDADLRTLTLSYTFFEAPKAPG